MNFSIDIPNDCDVELASDIIKIFNEILIEKILEKNKKYGNSLYEPAMILNRITDPIDLASIRVDDKLKRLGQMDRDDPKYWSEIKEIVAYLLNMINMRVKYEA
jgi:DNA repair ATPase RecN